MKFSDNLAKVLFVLSLVFLVFLYGFVSGYKSWPPKGFLDKALEQARDSGIYYALPFTDVPAPPHTYPQIYNREGVHIEEPDKLQSGTVLVTSLWDWDESGDLEVGAKLINKKGEIIHSWQVNRDKLFSNLDNWGKGSTKQQDVMGSYLFPNGDLLLVFDYTGAVRLDSCGEVLWELPEHTHHSVARANDGSFWMSAVHGEKRNSTKQYPNGFPGLGGKKVWVDRILHVSEAGKVLEGINVLDVLYMNGLERYIPKMLRNLKDAPADITHLNDVESLKPSMADEYPLFGAGDLLVSLKRLKLVFVFDPESKNVKWHSIKPFIGQHDADFIGDGWIGVFNNNLDYTNRGTMLEGGSRVVALQPHTGKVEVLFPSEPSVSDPLYTSSHGRWQILDNGNLFITEANAGRVVEVTPEGRTAWEWIHKPVGDSRVPVVEGTHYDLTKEDVASWPCSSASTSENTEQEGG